ncbi:Uncharacterised protein [Bordetella ansorpii]|uniref:Uncharacterized protein n=1 Tax=Bordetella ansorpii TaxID=288768 RepID=A0A157SWI4_9BORD|nr:Uncharacterised protein [Bordetella ansorpii]
MRAGSIAVVHRHYAHEKAARLLARSLADEGGRQVSWHGLSDYDDDVEGLRSALGRAAIVVLSCGGRDINRILHLFPESQPRPFFVSLFPGIVLRSQLDAFITRLRCDLVLLNSRADLESYGRICDLLRVPFNGILYGAGWFEAAAVDRATEAPLTVFFEQIDVPHRKPQRRALADGLARLALRHPERQFLIKARDPVAGTGRRSRGVDGHIDDRVSDFVACQRRLPNLHISQAPVSQLLSDADSCVTISSSAAIEALLMGRRTYLLADYPARQNYGGFFQGSGLLVRLADLDPGRQPAPIKEWLHANVMDPRTTLPEIRRAIERQQKNPRPCIAARHKVLLAAYCGRAIFPEPHTFLRRTFKAFRLVEARVE